MSSATIEFRNLSKQYKDVLAVSNFSAQVHSGRVTGFLGPNGAGKSTALRCLVGLVNPTSGEALINGAPYSYMPNPITEVGAVLDSRGFHPGLTAFQNMKVMASASGIEFSRIEEVLKIVDLEGAINVDHKRSPLVGVPGVFCQQLGAAEAKRVQQLVWCTKQARGEGIAAFDREPLLNGVVIKRGDVQLTR